MGLTKAGLPTVCIVTVVFEKLARARAKAMLCPELAIVVVEHPIADLTQEGVERVAEGCFREVLAHIHMRKAP